MRPLIGAGFGFLYSSCRRAGARSRTAALLTLSGLLVATGPPAPRPQALAVPLFTGTWLLLARRGRWTWLVPVLAMIWANVHGSFVLAPVLIIFALADDLIERRSANRTVLVLLATVAATFVNPFGLSVWSYAVENLQQRDDPELGGRAASPGSTVAEWGPSGCPASWSSPSRWKRAEVRPLDVAVLASSSLWACRRSEGPYGGRSRRPGRPRWFRSTEPVIDGPEERRPDMVRAIAAVYPRAPPDRGDPPLRGRSDDRTSQRLALDAPEVLVDATRGALPVGSRPLRLPTVRLLVRYSLSAYPVMVDSRIGFLLERCGTTMTGRSQRRGLGGDPDRHRIEGVVLPPDAVLRDALSMATGWRRVVDGPAGSVFVRA